MTHVFSVAAAPAPSTLTVEAVEDDFFEPPPDWFAERVRVA